MKSLLARLLLIVSIAVVPALAFQAYTEGEARRARQQLVEDEALRLVRLVASEQQRIVEGAEQVLAVIGGAPAVQDDLPALCQRLLTNLLQQSPRYSSAGVIGLDGVTVCAPVPVDRSLNASDRAYFRLALQTGGFAVGEYAISRATNRPVIHMARPFKHRDGTVAGVVMVALDLDWLGRQFRRIDLPPGALVSVMDRNGTILARVPGDARFVGQAIPAKNRFILDGSTVGVAPMTSLEGDRALMVAYSPLGADPKGLAVGVGLERETTFAPALQANRTGLVLIVTGAGLALALTYLAGTQLIRRPLDRLLHVADRWRSGDLTARTGLAADGTEFGRLAAAFDSMAGALDSRERALRTALESTADCVLVLDRDWRITYLNENAKRQIGQDRDLVGEIWWEALPGTLNSVFANAYRTAMASGVPTHTEGYSDTFQTWFETHAYPSKDGLTVFYHDITEQRRIAAALRQSEELYRATFEQAGVGMTQAALDGTWQRVNDQMCTILGYAREELVGQNFLAVTHPDDRDGDTTSRAALFAGETETITREKRYLRKDGGTVWANVTVSLLRDAEGEPERIITIVQDISERRRIEAALRESETRLQLAREAAGFGVWDRDLIAGTAIWSEEEWRLYGLEPQPGGPPHEAWHASLHPDDRARVVADVAAALADSACRFDTDYRVVWPDGTVHWLLSKATVVRDASGTAVRMVGLNMDVTASRETEAALRRLSSELEARVAEEVAAREAAQARAAHAERMQALGQLAGGIAHDFNNVLQGVSGAAALIERRPGDEAGVRRLARLAIEASERGASITRRLLAFGRRGDLRAEAFDVGSLLGGLREILAHTLGAPIGITVQLGADLPLLLADKGQLETALVNLATNARDAMPEGGRLTLAADTEIVPAGGATHPAGLAPGRYVRLTVADTGVGMDTATLARAGEPFFTTKDLGVGTGLGLPMAKGFAEQSGGALGIESSPGKGCTVTLWLPAAEAPQAARGGAAGPIAGAEPGSGTPGEAATHARVLLVDDEALVREVLAEHLEDAGYGVVVAASGAEALALLAAGEAVDALVTDLSMPGMDGLAVIRAAQERRPGLPAVLLTGYAGDGAALAVGGAVSGTFSLLRKPVSGVLLVDRVRALLVDGGRRKTEV